MYIGNFLICLYIFYNIINIFVILSLMTDIKYRNCHLPIYVDCGFMGCKCIETKDKNTIIFICFLICFICFLINYS